MFLVQHLEKLFVLWRTDCAINPLIAKAIAMGDEFHQRNIAASLVFYERDGSDLLQRLKDISEKDRYDVIKFLADTDQFFLNIMMATGKAVMDDARTRNRRNNRYSNVP